MAAHSDPANLRQAQSAERELVVETSIYGWLRYEGTADQLIAEGLIPRHLEWPRAAAEKCWEVGGFDYCLSRKRPKGHKGSMRSWLGLDNWCVRIQVSGRDWRWYQSRVINRKVKELQAEIIHHLQSEAGGSEWHVSQDRYRIARCDVAFQAFKSGLLPKAPKPKGVQ
ncbi:hypothetical protein [Ideonella sp.]|uniref:hypothetical protein n=1 Tax=Ideonella sp. TaxID=1929293 RepID=UPI0035AF7B8E